MTVSSRPLTTPVTHPGDLAALVPYQLGFVPRDSIVAVALRRVQPGPGGRPRHASEAVARIDLPVTSEEVAPLVEVLALTLVPADPDDVLLVVFGSDQRAQGEPPARPDAPLAPADLAVTAAEQYCAYLEGEGIGVLDVLYVEDARWLSLTCWGQDCCSPLGRAVPLPHEVAAVADFVARGTAPAADREAVEASVRAGSDPMSDLVRRELGPVRAARRRSPVTDRTVLRRWRDALLRPAEAFAVDPRQAQPLPTPATVARLVAELEADDQPAGTAFGLDAARPPRCLRDAVLTWCCPDDIALASLPGEVLLLAHEVFGPARERTPDECSALVDRLAAIVRCVPAEASADVCALLAAVAWHCGDPVRARSACDQALAAHPKQRLAGLVARGLDLGVRPGGQGLVPA